MQKNLGYSLKEISKIKNVKVVEMKIIVKQTIEPPNKDLGMVI
jgi:hypothetical protein